MKPRRTFREILGSTAEQNSIRLMSKARTANQIAKRLSGNAKALAYQVKCELLEQLVEKFPNETRIRTDANPSLLIIEGTHKPFGLHVPISLYAPHLIG